VTNAFSSKTHAEHAPRRRRIAGVYTKTFIQNSPHLAAVTRTIIDGRLLPLMTEMARKGETFCMLRLSWAASFDLITSFIFGLEAGTNLLADLAEVETIAGFYDDSNPQAAFWKKEVPLVNSFLTLCGWSPLGARNTRYKRAKGYLESWTLRMCDHANSVLERSKRSPQDMGVFPVVYAQMRKCVDQDHADSPPESKARIIASELFDHLCKW
jgi:hypothetical protein